MPGEADSLDQEEQFSCCWKFEIIGKVEIACEPACGNAASRSNLWDRFNILGKRLKTRDHEPTGRGPPDVVLYLQGRNPSCTSPTGPPMKFINLKPSPCSACAKPESMGGPRTATRKWLEIAEKARSRNKNNREPSWKGPRRSSRNLGNN